MEASFWHNMWKTNKIGFHLHNTNQFLIDHFDTLNLEKNSRVFIPLCGKTVDIKWLLDNGYKVAGAELSELAIKDLFESLGITPQIKEKANLKHFYAPNIDIYVGDIFNLDKQLLGTIDAVYDRAAIVALPEELRVKYTKHLVDITSSVKQLLITIEYEEGLIQGPPFSLREEAVKSYYEDIYTFELLEVEYEADFKISATERVWLLESKN